MLVLTYVLNPEYTGRPALYPPGHASLIGAAVLQIVGMIIIRRIVTVDM